MGKADFKDRCKPRSCKNYSACASFESRSSWPPFFYIPSRENKCGGSRHMFRKHTRFHRSLAKRPMRLKTEPSFEKKIVKAFEKNGHAKLSIQLKFEKPQRVTYPKSSSICEISVATGAKVFRWIGHGPCSFKASKCALVP